ncbi:DUF2163 domain-containing protein [Phaeovulum vinaykumarii]|uniref:Bacteriophage phiJL001 Gp84 C-terminal domain-containing protein n=1 Tax=Phaeovulum vinaykumarii TaxID=407234 RepID=A0A1N7JK75_9RHOB|nr:DUF2163 domain-containing protein [Phaeovulum vinaykumarii]SIS49727.1 phage conserved hypothetical protein BR0599 [Phaeovulum vinaykumarii]SOB89872.1 uncharacterized phage protein (TIGR02218 family) [Phaeovulum vinaykumarii]
MSFSNALKDHLGTGATTLCRAWAVARTDGVVLGFTDHDGPLDFAGIAFRPESGMTALALEQSTGLSVDNTEIVGALSSAAITEADISAGRYDGAEVTVWLVNWRAPEMRAEIFRGAIGEVRRTEGRFTAELRGQAAPLGDTQGRIFHPRCAAVLGDAACGVDLSGAGYRAEWAVEEVSEGRIFVFASQPGFSPGWFEKGKLTVLEGPSAGLIGVIKTDREDGQTRRVELWQAVRAELAPGTRLRLEAGCDRRAETCRSKFANFANFRGFPHVPGDDWLTTYPAQGARNDGGSLFK